MPQRPATGDHSMSDTDIDFEDQVRRILSDRAADIPDRPRRELLAVSALRPEMPAPRQQRRAPPAPPPPVAIPPAAGTPCRRPACGTCITPTPPKPYSHRGGYKG